MDNYPVVAPVGDVEVTGGIYRHPDREVDAGEPVCLFTTKLRATFLGRADMTRLIT